MGRRRRLAPDGQDHEWVAIFVLEAPAQISARSRVTEVATTRAERTGEPSLSVTVEDLQTERALPILAIGTPDPDGEIGW